MGPGLCLLFFGITTKVLPLAVGFWVCFMHPEIFFCENLEFFHENHVFFNQNFFMKKVLVIDKIFLKKIMKNSDRNFSFNSVFWKTKSSESLVLDVYFSENSQLIFIVCSSTHVITFFLRFSVKIQLCVISFQSKFFCEVEGTQLQSGPTRIFQFAWEKIINIVMLLNIDD